jgi:hypothetical protein
MTVTAYKAFPSVTPSRVTSAKQGVFGVTLGSSAVWPEGTTITHSLDGTPDTFDVPADQGTTPVYFPYHDLAIGVHDWEGTVNFPDGSTSTLYPFTWEIVEPVAQTPVADEVTIEGTVLATGGAIAQG